MSGTLIRPMMAAMRRLRLRWWASRCGSPTCCRSPRSPASAGHDPDFYLRGGRQLAAGSARLALDVRRGHAVDLAGGRTCVAAALSGLPVHLRVVPLSAAHGAPRAAGVLSIASIAARSSNWVAGCIRRATGLIAAGGFALWALNILNVWHTSQEALYIPLVAARVRAAGGGARVDDAATRVVRGGCGVRLRGVDAIDAALLPAARGRSCTSSMSDRPAQRVARRGTAPRGPRVARPRRTSSRCRCTWASSRQSTRTAAFTSRGVGGPDDRALSMSETVGALTATHRRFTHRVSSRETADRARSLLHVNGGRVLQIYVAAGTASTAMIWKIALHVTVDLLLVSVLILAPFGVVLARDRPAGGVPRPLDSRQPRDRQRRRIRRCPASCAVRANAAGFGERGGRWQLASCDLAPSPARGRRRQPGPRGGRGRTAAAEPPLVAVLRRDLVERSRIGTAARTRRVQRARRPRRRGVSPDTHVLATRFG